MVGKNHQGVFLTLDQRKRERYLAIPVARKKADNVTEAIPFIPIRVSWSDIKSSKK
jgi:hypothetical protein